MIGWSDVARYFSKDAIAHLATLEQDGGPHVVPLWIDRQNVSELAFFTIDDRARTATLATTPPSKAGRHRSLGPWDTPPPKLVASTIPSLAPLHDRADQLLVGERAVCLGGVDVDDPGPGPGRSPGSTRRRHGQRRCRTPTSPWPQADAHRPGSKRTDGSVSPCTGSLPIRPRWVCLKASGIFKP